MPKYERAIHLDYFDPAVGKVRNPGMGVQGYVHSDHMRSGFSWKDIEPSNTSEQFPLDRESFDKMAASPHLDNFYFRIDWKMIQKEKGKLDLPASFEWMLDACRKYGKSWSFRIMSSNVSADSPDCVPDFAKDKVKLTPYWRVFGHNYPKYFPVYDQDFLNYWDEMMNLLGEKFDKDPALEFGDVSGYGFWGEAHHYCLLSPDQKEEYNYEPDDVYEVTEHLLRAHQKAFPTTPVCMNLNYGRYPFGEKAIADNEVWVRRDSFQAHMSTKEYENISKLTEGGCMIWEPVQPHIQHTMPLVMTPKQFCQHCLDYGANYLALSFNPWDFNLATHNYQDVMDFMDERVGYRLRPSMLWRRQNEDLSQDIAIELVNDGMGSIPGILTLKIEYPDGTVVTKTLKPGEPGHADKSLKLLPVPEKYINTTNSDNVKLKLRCDIQLRGKTYPVRWAVRQELFNPFEIVVPLREFIE